MSKFPRESHREAELVTSAQNGDLGAFNTLVGRYRSGALVLARQILPNREQAEDAVQDSFLAAFKALPQLVDPDLFANWFGSIVRHRSRRLAAGAAKHRLLPLDELILSYAPSISAEIETKARSDIVRCAVAGLSEEVKPVVHLYYLEDWRVGTIAEFLALPESTVKWRLNTGRKLLRKVLSEELEESNESGK